MSVRYRITNKETINGTTITYRADILDSEYGSDIEEKKAGNDFFDWSYPKIDERDPFEKPVQSSSLTVDLFVESSSELALLTDILDADESRFTIEFYIDDTHKWSGSVLNDLIEYSEGQYPFTATIQAKDLSVLEGKEPNIGLISERSRLSEILALCFQETGFSFPIRSFTNVTNTEVTEANDFLYELWHENRAFYDGAIQMSALEVLEYICRAYNLIIRQSDARWLVEQLPAVAKGDDDQFDYDSDGLNPTSSTPDRTITIDDQTSFLLPTSQNKVTGALKRIESIYNHKTPIYTVPTEPVDYTSDPGTNTDKFSVSFGSKGSHAFSGEVDAEAELSESNPGGSVIEAYFRVRGIIPGGDDTYMDNSGSWSTTQQKVSISLSGSGTTVTGSFNIEQSDGIGTPETIEVEFLFAEVVDDVGTGVTVTETHYSNINMFVFQTSQSIQDKEATIRYRYTRTGNYSVDEEIPKTVLGDGPTLASVGAPASDEFGTTTLTPGNFIVRGESAGNSITLEQLTLRERTSMRRGSLRNLRASLWMKYSPESLIEYDGETWFFLGGQLVGRQSRWDVNILNLGYSRESGDSFTTVVESGGDPEGTSGTDTEDTTSGISLVEGDNRYLQESLNLSDLDNISTARDNLGLTDQTADLDLNSLAINGDDLFTLFYTETEIDSFFDLYLSEADLTDGDEDLYLNSLELQSGKFLSPTSYQFRNTGDTGFRDVEMAGLTATTGTFSGLTTHQDGVTIVNGNFDNHLRIERDSRYLTTTIGVDNSYRIGESSNGIDFISIQKPVAVNDINPDGNALLVSSGNLYWERDAKNHEISLGSPSAETGIIFNETGNADRSRFNVINNSNATVSDRFFSLGYDDNDRILNIRYNRNVGINTATPTEALDVNGNGAFSGTLGVGGAATFDDSVLSDLFDNDTWAGSGYRGTNSGDWVVENLRVRNALEVYEFVAKQISSVGGKEILSIANGRIESIDTGANEIEVQDVRGQNATSFEAGDLWIVQVVDINNDLEGGGTGSIVRSVRGSVDSVSGATLTVTVDSGALSDLEQNDLIVAYGSSNSARNAIMYRNVDRSDDNLIMRMQTGITSFADLTAPANTSVAYGDLNGYLGISSEEFGFFAGDVGGNYVLATENQVDINTNSFDLSISNLVLESDTPKLALGASADSIDLTTGTGFYANGGGHFKAGSTSDYIKWDGNNLDLATDTFTLDTGGGFQSADLYLNSADGDFSLGSNFYWDGSATELGLTGTLLMGTGSEITNSGDDYIVSEDGFGVFGDGSATAAARYKIYDTGGTQVGQMYYNGTDTVSIGSSTEDIELFGQDILIIGGSGGVGGAGSVTLAPQSSQTTDGYLVISGLPTANPGGSNRVWNDGGTLKIT